MRNVTASVSNNSKVIDELKGLARVTDYSRPDDTMALAALIFSAADTVGLLTQDKTLQSIEARVVVEAARQWTERVRPNLEHISAAEALALIDHYEMMHRIACGTPAPQSIVDRHVLRAFEARIHGDSDVDQYRLLRAISRGLRQRNPAYMERPLQWYTLTIDRWYRLWDSHLAEEDECGSSDIREFDSLSAHDRREIAAALRAADLSAYTPDPSSFKSRLQTHL